MGILPQNPPRTQAPAGNSRREFNSLADYAAYQGAPESMFVAAGWQIRPVMHPDPQTYQPRRALEYRTASGPRWRFIDGVEGAKYTSPKGYERCWYGLQRAADIAQQTGQPLVIANGEAGVIVGQYHGIAATAITGGETGTIPPALLDTLKAAYPSGRIIVAQDCDNRGRDAGPKLARALCDAGYEASAADLQLPDKGDLADFCRLHGNMAGDMLPTLPTLALPEPKPIFQPRESREAAHAGELVWEDERRLWWLDVVLPAVERAAAHRRRKHFRCINPHHADNNPSARISTDKNPDGVYICTCCQDGAKRETVGEWLGLDFMTWWKDIRAHLYQRQQRPDDTMPDYADILQDAGAIWDELPALSQSDKPAIESDTPHYMQSNEGADWFYAVALAQSFAPKNTGAILLDMAKNDPDVWYDLNTLSILTGIEYDALHAYFTKPTHHEQLLAFFSIEKDIPPMEKKTNNSGRPAELYVRLYPVGDLISALERRRDDAIGMIAAEFDGKALPMQPQANYLERVDGITPANAAAALEAWHIATDRALEGAPDFADDYRLFTGRAGEIQRTFTLIRQRADDLTAFEINPKRRGKDSAHNVLAAELYEYYFTLLGEDKDHPVWLDCALIGVSAPTLRKKVKPLAGLRYKGDTHEYVTIRLDSAETAASLSKKIATTGKSLRGRPLAIRADSSDWRPCKTENYARVIDCAAKDGGMLTVRVSVSRPLERYTPPPAAFAQAAQRSNTMSDRPKMEQQERKPRIQKRQRNIVRESIMRLPEAFGWQYDKERALWRDPGRLLWPDDPLTILQALSDRPIVGATGPLGKAPVSEDQTMLNIHHQAAKYDADEPEETLPVEQPVTLPRSGKPDIWEGWNWRAAHTPTMLASRHDRQRAGIGV